MKGIYIVLTHTGTILSKIIKSYTKDEFSHSSISLDVELNEMYSFGRLRPYNTFVGGFVHESIHQGTFKRFYKTKAKIYCLMITEEQYEKIESIIQEMKIHKEEYKFNLLGLFAAGFHKRIGKDDSFYCAEFVKYLLDKAGVETNLPKVVKPEDFKQIEGLEEIYSGLLRKYSISKNRMGKLIEEKMFLLGRKENMV